jgi:hypothetical protein
MRTKPLGMLASVGYDLMDVILKAEVFSSARKEFVRAASSAKPL